MLLISAIVLQKEPIHSRELIMLKWMASVIQCYIRLDTLPINTGTNKSPSAAQIQNPTTYTIS